MQGHRSQALEWNYHISISWSWKVAQTLWLIYFLTTGAMKILSLWRKNYMKCSTSKNTKYSTVMHIKSLFWDSKAFSSACVGKSSCKWKFCCLESKSLTFHQHNFSLYNLKNWRQVCFLFYMYKWICKLKSFLNQELSLLTYIEA